jgi:hypothetical protein
MPRKRPQVFGVDLNRSESSRQPALPTPFTPSPPLGERRHRSLARLSITAASSKGGTAIVLTHLRVSIGVIVGFLVGWFTGRQRERRRTARRTVTYRGAQASVADQRHILLSEVGGSGVISSRVARGSTLTKDSLRSAFRWVHHPFKAADPTHSPAKTTEVSRSFPSAARA